MAESTITHLNLQEMPVHELAVVSSRKSKVPIILGSLLCVACQTEDARNEVVARTSSALIGGVIDTEDPAVVAIKRSGGPVFCTGSLISPRVVLTAAHCIDMLGVDPSATVYFGSNTEDDGPRIPVKARKQHPMWTGVLANGYDVGMLLLDYPYSDPSIALPMHSTTSASDHIGEEYRQVGFGVFDRESQESDGQKRTGTTTILQTRGDVILSGDEQLSVCFGDSGGPGFLTVDGKEVIAGIHSYTTSISETLCIAPNGDTSVQRYAEEFIVPWVNENDLSCGFDGVCGPVGCVKDPDCVPCGPDGVCVENCELPDPDCQTQQIGDICRGNGHCLSEQCIIYNKDPNYRFCTKNCSGDADCGDGMSCQAVGGLGKVCYFEDSPAGVLGDSCATSGECGSYECQDGVCVTPCDARLDLLCPADTFECKLRDEEDKSSGRYCYEIPDEGGCAAGGNSGNWGALLLGGLILARGRRRKSANG